MVIRNVSVLFHSVEKVWIQAIKNLVLAGDIYQIVKHFVPVTVHILHSSLGPRTMSLVQAFIERVWQRGFGRTSVTSPCEPCRKWSQVKLQYDFVSTLCVQSPGQEGRHWATEIATSHMVTCQTWLVWTLSSCIRKGKLGLLILSKFSFVRK